jgi:hypothetical protein
LVAFLESEPRNGFVDRTGDFDSFDHLLRVYDAAGTERTLGQTIVADPAPVVNGAPLVADASGLVFFRARESDATARATIPILTGLGFSGRSSLSADGRFVAFSTSGTGHVPGDTNGVSDVFIADRDPDADGVFDEAGSPAFSRVSVVTGGAQANGASINAAISPDGRQVAFESSATNLVVPDGNGTDPDIFVHDRLTGATVRVNNSPTGSQLGASQYPSIGAGGRFVTFTGTLIDRDADQDGILDEYAESGAVTSRSVPGGVISLSDDGGVIGFATGATNIGFLKTTPWSEVYFERPGILRRRMPTVDGLEPNDDSDSPIGSANGADPCVLLSIEAHRAR